MVVYSNVTVRTFVVMMRMVVVMVVRVAVAAIIGA